MLKKIPLLIVCWIIFLCVVNQCIPLYLKNILFSISITVKSVIVFMIPIIIFSLVFKSAVKLSDNGTKTILLIIFMICTSNFISTSISQFIGKFIYDLNLPVCKISHIEHLKQLWIMSLENPIKNEHALLSGITIGIITSLCLPKVAIKFADIMGKFINLLLKMVIILIPLFITGFIIKILDEGSIYQMTKHYGTIMLITVLCLSVYSTMLYLVANNFKISSTIESMKNMIPAIMTGFSTMSSAAAMPFAVIAAEQNTKNKDLASATVSATVNFHLVGDCFAIPIFAYAILRTYDFPIPSIDQFFVFTVFFVFAKFSVAAVPSGGILVMIPILEKYMNFSPEMTSLITAIYLIFDPIITSFNILANGAFAMLIDKIHTKTKN